MRQHSLLDPRIRLLSLFWIASLIIAAETWVTLGATAALVISGLTYVRVRLADVMLLMRKVLFFVLVIMVIQGSSHSGGVLFAAGGYYFTSEGLASGAFLSLKIILLAFLSRLFVSSTSIGEVFDALEWPLNHWRGSSSYLMTLGLTINFVPLLIRSARQIKSAQIARGGDDSASLFSQVRFGISAALPLFVTTLRRSHQLADAIDARGYNPATHRTPFAIMRTDTNDWLWVGLLVAVTAWSILSK